MENTGLHSSHGAHSGIFSFLTENLGEFGHFLDEVVIHGLLEALMLIPFLYLTYLLMEFIEHKASDKTRAAMAKAGRLGPLVGAPLGAIPQCGFSTVASNLYTGGVITLGTLVSVFLSTSDEMLPIFLAGNVDIVVVLLIIVYKIIVAIAAGFVIDLALKLLGKDEVKRNIDDICEEEGCHCERGIFLSALHHTVTVWLWCLAVILALNSLVFFVGTEHLAAIVPDIPVISHLICAVIGLIPNCAASVALSELALSGVISVGEMMAGLFSAAGVGLFVLFKMNKSKRENWLVVLLVLLVGTVFGAVADLIPVFKL
ncbi:MAG: arsenic efflux protein [Clostridia bacterium]|nr:arsenic efflux protein [Clostridia bacterium]